MGFIPQITCRHCGKKFSAIYNRCPGCGTRRVKQTSRAASTTSSVRPGSSANVRASANARWQFIFGCVLIVAVIAAVIVLISTSLKGSEALKASPSPSPSASTAPSPSPTPIPTPTPTPTPSVTSIVITFLGSPLTNNEFATTVGDKTDLDAEIYPVETEAEVTWTSANESICTVDEKGVVTGVGAGWGSVTASCGGIETSCRVWVR